MSSTHACKLCGSDTTTDFFDLPPVPTQDGIMAQSENAAQQAAKGAINLRFCRKCSFVRNEGYEAEKISFSEYDFSNDHSPLFNRYINDLSDRLIKHYQLHHKTILDIGCGDGKFLKMICQKGNNKGIGIDPGFDFSNSNGTGQADIRFFRTYYSEEHHTLAPDFIACRLVIDLLDDPAKVLRVIRKNIGNKLSTIVYIEVPNAAYTFGNNIFWNVAYEHSSWYTPESFRFQLEQCGFEVLHVAPCWNDEFLGIEVRPSPDFVEPESPASPAIAHYSKMVETFSTTFQQLMQECDERIQKIREEQIKTIAWGAGARALTFFNMFDLKGDVPYIIDINPNRHNKFLPGSAQQIMAPEYITDYQPELVIITNPTYEEEIKEQISELGIRPEYWVL